MGIRFRRSIKIMPGVKVNLSKRGISTSFGTRGVHYTIGSNGRRTSSIGIPGTGISSVSTWSKKRKTNNVSQVSLYSKNTTLILCIFLGMFGIHRFYVKRSGTGILWMFSFGLFLFGWISDIISILNGTFTDGLGRSLR